jgi:hypothetical protein
MARTPPHERRKGGAPRDVMALFSYTNPDDARSEIKGGHHLTRAPETARVRSICAILPPRGFYCCMPTAARELTCIPRTACRYPYYTRAVLLSTRSPISIQDKKFRVDWRLFHHRLQTLPLALHASRALKREGQQQGLYGKEILGVGFDMHGNDTTPTVDVFVALCV